ncbi:MAG TPA: DUF2071 domain-containing protein [Saprospiraceae bacterium]|nr:DUF2071 domain-containing protein [Saprospiraceae bacterium]
MFSFLKNHPFSVEAYFESSIVLTFAVPKEEIQNLIPECLELDTFNNTWAFIAVALVHTKGLRPKGFPVFMGNDFILIGYRIFVKYTNNAGKRLRGLYILKSETNKKSMEYLGNIFTQYYYTTTDIKYLKLKMITEIRSNQSGFSFVIDESKDVVSLPTFSPFEDWKEARRFAGPLPFTFSYNPGLKQVLIIEGVRQNWIPTPISVLEYKISLFDEMSLSKIVLANSFIIHDIPYFWKKGKIEIWNG